jgi:hypothetical protein
MNIIGNSIWNMGTVIVNIKENLQSFSEERNLVVALHSGTYDAIKLGLVISHNLS